MFSGYSGGADIRVMKLDGDSWIDLGYASLQSALISTDQIQNGRIIFDQNNTPYIAGRTR